MNNTFSFKDICRTTLAAVLLFALVVSTLYSSLSFENEISIELVDLEEGDNEQKSELKEVEIFLSDLFNYHLSDSFSSLYLQLQQSYTSLVVSGPFLELPTPPPDTLT